MAIFMKTLAPVVEFWEKVRLCMEPYARVQVGLVRIGGV